MTKSETFRSYAIICEIEARAATDPASKREWEVTATNWHWIANRTAETNEEDPLEV